MAALGVAGERAIDLEYRETVPDVALVLIFSTLTLWFIFKGEKGAFEKMKQNSNGTYEDEK